MDWKIDFEVTKQWRGVGNKKVMTVSVGSGVCCDCSTGPRPFTPGEVYTLNGLSHGDCGSVSLKMSAADVTEVLGKPKQN